MMLLGGLGGREADVMVGAKGKEHALAPMGLEIVYHRVLRSLRKRVICTQTLTFER
jgi:hypothetical protein